MSLLQQVTTRGDSGGGAVGGGRRQLPDALATAVSRDEEADRKSVV